MNDDIISKLIPAAMIENADGIADSFRKMSVNIDRVLRSDFVSGEVKRASAVDTPIIIRIGEDGEAVREDVALQQGGCELLRDAKRYDEPYITVPRIV